MSAIAELVEPRMLLSAESPLASPVAVSSFHAAPAMKQLEIIAEYKSFVPRIDEIRIVGSEIQVFSTYDGFRSWPGVMYLMAPGFYEMQSSEPVTINVPAEELPVVHFFANRDQPQIELYHLRAFGTSALLYRRPDADADSGWIIKDVDPGAGSTTGLDFTAPPPVPQGLVTTSESENSVDVTLFFDESPTSEFAGQRFVRRYEIRVRSEQSWNDSQFVAFDNTRFSMKDASGVLHAFGGRKEFTLAPDVYAWSVRVQTLPVFPDSATGENALASPWSEWSDDARFSILPAGEQILVGKVHAESTTSVVTIEWGPVRNAATYEVWIDRVSDGKLILHETGLTTWSLNTEPLDPDKYRFWVRATRIDGTRTSWSKFKEIIVDMPRFRITSSGVSHDATPTIEWTRVPHSTHYQITVYDSLRRQHASPTQFESDEAYRQYITAYTRTVVGSSSSHTVDTPLALTNDHYDFEVVLHFANGASTQTSDYLRLEPVGVPIRLIPLGQDPYSMTPEDNILDGFRWNSAEGVVSYDVWLAYLGFSLSASQGGPKHPPQWKFATEDAVTNGLYHLPSDAPGGTYRIWLRANTESAGRVTKGAWHSPVNIWFRDPVNRPMNISLHDETLTWDSVPGATGYSVSIEPIAPLDQSNVSSKTENLALSETSFRIPDAIMDGTYRVRVGAQGGFGWQGSPRIQDFIVEHGVSPWVWKIRRTADQIQWNSVPNAVSYDVQVTNSDTGNIVMDVSHRIDPRADLPTNLADGHYRVKVRALRSVNGREFLTEWASVDFDYGAEAPSNIQLNGNILSWDAQDNASYEVTIRVPNGRLSQNVSYFTRKHWPNDPHILFSGRSLSPYAPAFQLSDSLGISASSNAIDLSQYLRAVYSFELNATLSISIKARILKSTEGLSYIVTAASDPVEFTLPQPWKLTDQIVEQTSRPAPPAPVLVVPDNTSVAVQTYDGYRRNGVGSHVYWSESGVGTDVEYVTRYQLRVTDRQTGTVRTFDESLIPDLMQLSDEFEPGFLSDVFPSALDMAFTGATISLTKQLRLQGSIYKVEARVQYLPVVLADSGYVPYTTLLTDTTQPTDRINVAATPWSDWSNSQEYTILPDGQNILPLSQSPTTITPRPTFAWGSNTANAQYELWVENRATKQRGLHETLSNIREFQSPTDLPAGQYDWWVRIVGTTGPRNGWSAKQSLEIFAPAITTSVVAETVDATPVVSWSAASGAQSYAVTFTSTTTGNVVYQATEAADKTSHRVTTILPNDTYSVSIQASLPNEARTAPGAVNASGGFVLKRMTVGSAPKNVTISNSKVTWQAVDSATRYNVWINYIDSTGKTEHILRQDAFGTELPLSASLTQRPGAYRVWIRAIRSEAGQEYTGRWSEVKTLQVSSASPDSNALAIIMSELAITGVLDGAASM